MMTYAEWEEENYITLRINPIADEYLIEFGGREGEYFDSIEDLRDRLVYLYLCAVQDNNPESQCK